ncbi:MAG TPA: DUF1634 domain-containing protein [Bryobacteraceae bacterium]
MDSNNNRLESWVGYILRYGVMLAAAVVLAGGIGYLHGAAHQGLPDYTHFHSGSFQNGSGQLDTFEEIAARVRAGEPNAIIQLGLLLLILTPIARVALCILGFALEKNRLYVAVSCIVMTVLMFSLMHGL